MQIATLAGSHRLTDARTSSVGAARLRRLPLPGPNPARPQPCLAPACPARFRRAARSAEPAHPTPPSQPAPPRSRPSATTVPQRLSAAVIPPTSPPTGSPIRPRQFRV